MPPQRRFDHDECRALYAAGGWSYATLAERYGVSRVRIYQIIRPEAKIRAQQRSVEWARKNYRQPCARCGEKIWKKGNATSTGLCRRCVWDDAIRAPCGTETAYSRGCRCDECKSASADARRARRHADIEATRAYDRERKRRVRASR